ncbi:MAG: hypothetical protein VKP62_17000, partial [Candidatus Sericytochromatia bacterium]|nr:hypothetical protein [Candidatus Sericytochromatia bacterium]
EFVAEVMDQLGMASQETFTKDDFVKVMGRITDFGKDMIQNAPLLESDDAEARTHMAAMLDALKAHALPLLQRSSADVS